MFDYLMNGQKQGLLGDDWEDDLTDKPERIQNGRQYRSSAISSVVWDGRDNAKVKYRGGKKVYDFPMDKEEFDDLKNSLSKGKWFWTTARRYGS